MRSFGGRENIHIEGPSLGYIMATETAKSIVVFRPFFFWPVIVGNAVLIRQLWPANMWVVAFLAIVAVMMAAYVWFLTRSRGIMGHLHGSVSVLALGAVFSYIDMAGWHKPSLFMLLIVVPLGCVTWSIRAAVRDHEQYDSAHLAGLFSSAGMPGTKVQVHTPEPNTRTGPARRRTSVRRSLEMTLHLKPGETAESVSKNARSIESHAGWPPGTITSVSQHPDHAGKAKAVLSDPRVIKEPIPHPGPLLLNGSVADPISVGVYQDGSECEFVLPETQIQVMGQVGSGKSLGAAWSTLAELVTRKDAVIWAIDVTKGRQTLGPLEDSLHWLATTPREAIEVLRDANRLIKPRTDYLAEKGLGKWKKGCGLKYLVVWIEEVPEVMEALGDEGEALWIKSVKAARSAGITFVWSLQRADYSQIPTITRGQAIKWCFGVADAHEASFGLSTAQNNADCSPEQWGQRQPGMCYLDAPSIPADKLVVPLRTWYWGTDDSLIRAHAENYPASDRPYDSVMVKVLGTTSSVITEEPEPVEDTEVTDRVINEEDDLPDEVLDEELEPIEGDFDLVREEPTVKPGSEAARARIREWLVARAGQQVRNSDLTELRTSMGYSRQWSSKVLNEFEASGLITRDDEASSRSEGISWTVTDDPEILGEGRLASD